MTKDATEGAKSGTTAAANAELYSMGPRAHLEVLYGGTGCSALDCTEILLLMNKIAGWWRFLFVVLIDVLLGRCD